MKHVNEEGSREHVLSWDSNGTHCSEPECEINQENERQRKSDELRRIEHQQYFSETLTPPQMSEPKLMACPWCQQIPQSIGHGFYMHRKWHGTTECIIGSFAATAEQWNTRHSATEGSGEAKFYREILEQISQDNRKTRARRLAESALTFWDTMKNAPAVKQSFTVQEGEQSKP